MGNLAIIKGFRFAKWRCVFKIDEYSPSQLALFENTWILARYAAVCQYNGLVPIVEAEILSDGSHSIEVTQMITEKVFASLFKFLNDNKVFIEGMLFKPNMVHFI
jgi:fructose-bisphosphate aldolase class I